MQRGDHSQRHIRPAGRTIAAVATATLLATTVAACHGKATAAPAPASGGTLNVILTSHAIGTLDPQEISAASDANVSRLIDRTLTTTLPDGTLVPDLATDTGRPSVDFTVWEFTIRPGVRWSDGSPVTCDDLKYGIERRYADTVAEADGLPYPMRYLVDNSPHYTGPYGLKQLNSIVCTDQHTVQFHLQRPVGDFGYTVSVPTFAPVKTSSDSGRAANDPFYLDPSSDGPYKVDPSQIKVDKVGGGVPTVTNLVLVRNTFWDAHTDTIRKAYPDTIALSFDADSAAVTNDLINSTGIYRNAVNLDQNVAPNFVQQVVNDPVLSRRTASGPAGGTTYAAINTRRIPAVACRQALEYAFDKRAFRFVLGGAVTGSLATTMIPPALAAHPDVDPYDNAAFPDGDVSTAARLMKSGDCRTTVRVAFPDLPVEHQEVDTIVDAYARIGVRVIPAPLDPQRYVGFYQQPGNPYDLMLTGWVPDWANGSAVIPPLFQGDQTHGAPGANLDFAEIDDAAVNSAIDEAYAEQSPQQEFRMWGQVDVKIVKDDAAVIPIVYPTALRLMGTNVRGAVISAGYGEPDLATIGLGAGS